MKQETKRRIIIIIGLVLIAYTLFALSISNLNLGVMMPLLLGTPIFLYGIFKPKADAFFKRRAGKVIKWIFICGYVFLIGLFTTCAVMMGVAAGNKPDDDAQAIIVLGAAVNGDEPSQTLKYRLDTAMGYAEENPDALIVVSGGKGYQENVSEAEAMEHYLLSKGVRADRILKEDRATSTAENFRYSKELLDSIYGNAYRVVYVTNDFHILRAGVFAQREGLDAEGLAAKTPILSLPNDVMRESLALLATWAFGKA